LITLIRLDDPAPWLRPHCDTQGLHSYYGRVRQRASNGTQLLADSAAWSSPSRRPFPGGSVRSRLHMFRTRAWTGLMLPICRTPPGQ